VVVYDPPGVIGVKPDVVFDLLYLRSARQPQPPLRLLSGLPPAQVTCVGDIMHNVKRLHYLLLLRFLQVVVVFVFAVRVEAQEKMASLKDRADKDVQQHNAEMKELIRIIDHDRRLREFMNAKSKERDEDQQLVAWRLRKG